jgi:23S rRNA-/tRNA-specific pseudouridylate synthase
MAAPPSLEVLYEDNHCLAVAKPAGVPSTHYDGTAETLDRVAKAYLKDKYAKPGNVFLGIVQRLDKPTSGVLLFARRPASRSNSEKGRSRRYIGRSSKARCRSPPGRWRTGSARTRTPAVSTSSPRTRRAANLRSFITIAAPRTAV